MNGTGTEETQRCSCLAEDGVGRTAAWLRVRGENPEETSGAPLGTSTPPNATPCNGNTCYGVERTNSGAGGSSPRGEKHPATDNTPPALRRTSAV